MNTKEKAKALQHIDKAWSLATALGREYDVKVTQVFTWLQYHIFDGSDAYWNGDPDTYTEVGIALLEMFDDHDIHVIGCGSYRVVFSYNGMVMKVNYNSDECEMELNKWNMIKRTSASQFVVPILDWMVTEKYGAVLFYPLVDTMTEEEWYSYSTCNEWGEHVDTWKEFVEVVENETENPVTRRLKAQYALLSEHFPDDHEGNWGIYKGRLVILDFASLWIRGLDGRSSLMRAFKRYMENPVKHNGLVEV